MASTNSGDTHAHASQGSAQYTCTDGQLGNVAPLVCVKTCALINCTAYSDLYNGVKYPRYNRTGVAATEQCTDDASCSNICCAPRMCLRGAARNQLVSYLGSLNTQISTECPEFCTR
jgi:hypothetical protein